MGSRTFSSLLLSGIGNGVLQAAGLAMLDSEEHVKVVDHEGRTGRGQDEAGSLF